jgi:hypothetical protein
VPEEHSVDGSIPSLGTIFLLINNNLRIHPINSLNFPAHIIYPLLRIIFLPCLKKRLQIKAYI